jgi:hypothetical protein
LDDRLCSLARAQSLPLCHLLLRQFRDARPGVRATQIVLPPHPSNAIRDEFQQLRRRGWLTVMVLRDHDGQRFSGWGVSLTPMGRMVLDALDRQLPTATVVASRGVEWGTGKPNVDDLNG